MQYVLLTYLSPGVLSYIVCMKTKLQCSKSCYYSSEYEICNREKDAKMNLPANLFNGKI